MAAHIEVSAGAGPELVVLEGDRVTLGKHPDNDVVVGGDPTVSRVHAVLDRYPGGWSVTDLGSRNGTWVNGERIVQSHLLDHGDQLLVGRTRIVYRNAELVGWSATDAAERPPDLTRREYDVLIALCRPLARDDVFSEPSPVRAIAEELVVTEAAVKHHLVRLYDKFGIHQGDERRRVSLANEAVRRGAITLASLREDPGRT